jgi:hypothetical protein
LEASQNGRGRLSVYGKHGEVLRGRIRSSAIVLAGAVSLAPALSGCHRLTTNVRALREYGNEDPEVAVVLDRLDDADATFRLVDRILARIPYSSGDAWTRDIALYEARAAEIKKAALAAPPYQLGEHEVPPLKVYRVHLEQVLRRLEAPRAGAALHASVLDALSTFAPAAAPIKERWERLQKAHAGHAEAVRAHAAALSKKGSFSKEAVQAEKRVEVSEAEVEEVRRDFIACATAIQVMGAGTPERAGIARDALTVTSVALRVLLEADALLSPVVDQARHLYAGAERDIWVQHSGEEMSLLSALPPRAKGIQARASAESKAMEPLAEAFAQIAGEGLYDTPGFALRDSILDQALGINMDAVRFRLRGDGEVLFFNQIGVSGSTNPGYVGQTRRLAYDVDPIGLIGGRLIIAFDWIHVRNAARLNAGFATDRLFGEGGEIVNSASLGAQLGLEGFESEAFDVGMDIIGIRTKVKSARFTSGEVHEIAVDRATGRDVGVTRTAPLQLAYTQVDVGYEVGFLLPEIQGKYWIEELLVGFRYMNYRLPRILYELEDADVDPQVSRFAFARESPPQTIESKYFMGGFAARLGQGDKRLVSLFGDIGVYGGSGPTSFYFLRDAAAADAPENREELDPAVIVLNASAGLGVRLRLTSRRSRLRLLLEGQYHGEFIGQAVVSEITGTKQKDGTSYTIGKTINYGGVDVYHGPRLQLAGVF